MRHEEVAKQHDNTLNCSVKPRITKSQRDELCDKLSEMAHLDKLDLQAFCVDGYPQWDCFPQIEGLRVDSKDGYVIEGSFEVTFMEETRTGCRDLQFHSPARGFFRYTANLSTWDIETEPSYDPHRRLDRNDPEF